MTAPSSTDRPLHPTALASKVAKAALINFVINGAVQYVTLREYAELPLTVDSISYDGPIVFGAAIGVAILIAAILSLVEYATLEHPKLPVVPGAMLLVIKHAFFTFAVAVALAVGWQRLVGTVMVSTINAITIIAALAAIIAAVITVTTIRSATKAT